MYDLISRKAAIEFANEQMVKGTGAYSNGRNAALLVMKSALNNPDAIPSVQAVPLEPLCEWLERNAKYKQDGKIRADQWNYVLTKWMEDDHR